MQCDEKNNKNEPEWYRPIGILGGREDWKICGS